MKKIKLSKIEKQKLRLRVKKIMDGIRGQSNLSFNYKLEGSIKKGEMSVDAQGRVDIDVDILIKLKDKIKSGDSAYQHVLKEIKKCLKDVETTKSQKRAIKINRPEFTIDIAIVDCFSVPSKKYIIRNVGGVFQWMID